MRYTIYKMRFLSGVHFGKGRIDNGDITCMADTLFSAMCIEALKMGGEKRLNDLVTVFRDGKALISDTFPYIGDTYYLPKPCIRVEKNDTDRNAKKQFKKMSYIPLEELSTYIKGNIQPEGINEELTSLNTREIRTRVSIEGEESTPYNIEVVKYGENNGIYMILGYEEDDIKNEVEDILISLSYTGIGGKTSSGLGKFELVNKKVPESLNEMLEVDADAYMTLSVSLPSDEELEEAVADGRYVLIKRSGFVNSSTYSDTFSRKKDIYMMKAGSCFKNRYQGDIYDVSFGGRHAVYRYGKPLMIGVR